MNDLSPFLLFGAGIILSLIFVVARRWSALTARLSAIVQSFGWEALRRVWWSGAWRGRWRGFEVQLRHNAHHKNIPEHLVLTIKAASPARIVVKRRGSFLSKPLTLFGPPMVEPAFRGSEQFWIRADEVAFVERLFSNAEVAAEIERNLIAALDVVELRPKDVRIVRAIDDRAVKKHFNHPSRKLGRDYELIDTIVAEEWRLAVMIIETLGLRGYEMA